MSWVSGVGLGVRGGGRGVRGGGLGVSRGGLGGSARGGAGCGVATRRREKGRQGGARDSLAFL